MNIAIRRAQRYKGTLIGVTIIDTPGIGKLSRGAQPGAIHMSEDSNSALINDAKRYAEALITHFRERCDRQSVAHEDIIHSGNPCDVLQEEAKTADLMFLGLKTYFHYPTKTGPGDTLINVLNKPVCPVIAVPEHAELPQNIIFAYDGTPGAARALKAYVHVTPDLPEEIQVVLLCVAKEYDKHKRSLEKAAVYLRSNGIEPEMLVRLGSPAEAILDVAKEKEPALIILGSPPYRGLAERLFGSVTETILKNGTVSVFVFH